MAAAAAANESDLQAAAAALEPAPTPAAAAADARPLGTLDPRLLMAARRGDSKALKDLLQLNDDDGNGDEQGEAVGRTTRGAGHPPPLLHLQRPRPRPWRRHHRYHRRTS